MGAWTDSRLDDVLSTLRPLPQQFARIGNAVDELEAETRAMREEMQNMREDRVAFQRQLAQIGWSLASALTAGTAGLAISLI